ncbi:MAG: hypothetical protein U0235_18540 [Polyangiaceae bacterium]
MHPFFRDNVYTYLIYDPANAKLFFSEQDQHDGGLVNTTLSTASSPSA